MPESQTQSRILLWQKLRSSPRLFPVAIIIFTLLLLLIFKSLQPEPPVKEKLEKTWSVQTIQLSNSPKSPNVELYARVESPYTATMTASINADVISLEVKEGSRVVKDQLLIQLDETDVKLVLEQRLSDVAELKAQIQSEKNRHKNDIDALKLEKSLVSLAEKKLEREEKTSKSNLTSQSSFDTQKQALQNQKLALQARQLNVNDHPARLSQLEARLKHNQALVEQAGHDLQRASIKAPFNGIILATMVSPGERVLPGGQLIKLFSTENIELRAQLPQKFVDVAKSALAQQQPMNASIKTSTGELPVHLRSLSGAIEDNGSGVDALFELDAIYSDAVTIGEVMEMVLTLPAIDHVFRVPVSSIYGTNRIYRVEDQRLVAIHVEKAGLQVDGEKQFVLVRSDRLAAGDEIITTQLPHAVSGLKVEIRNTASADNSNSLSARDR